MKDLKFVIASPQLEELTLENSPIGWDENFIQLQRSEEFHGMFRSYTVNLQFVGDGAQRLKDIYYNYANKSDKASGYNAKAKLHIYKLDPIKLTYSLFFTGDFDFATFKESISDYSIEITVVEGGLIKLFKKNKSLKFNSIFGQDVNLIQFAIADSATGIVKYNLEGIQISDYIKQLFDFICAGGYTGTSTQTGNTGIAQYAPGTFDIDCSYFDKFNWNGKTGLVLWSKWLGAMELRSSFDELFQSLNAVFSIGCGIELINGKETLVIREKDYFYDNQTIIEDLGEVSNLTVETDKEIIINEIAIGYESQDYSNGISSQYEVNQGSVYRIELESNPAPKKLELISKYRADFTGLLDILDNNIEADDIFYSYLIYNGYMDEIIANDNGLIEINSIFKTLYNATLTPRHILLNHAKYLNSIYYGITSDTTTIRFISSDLNNLHASVSGFPTDPYVKESEPIAITSDILFMPFIFTFDAVIGLDFLSNYVEYPNGVYQFTHDGNEYRGFLIEAKIKVMNKSSATIKLLCSSDTMITNLK